VALRISDGGLGGLGDSISVLEGLDAGRRDFLIPRHKLNTTQKRAPLRLTGPQLQVGPFTFPKAEIDGPNKRSSYTVRVSDLIAWTRTNNKPIGTHPLLVWLTQRVGDGARANRNKTFVADGRTFTFEKFNVHSWKGWGFPDGAPKKMLEGKAPVLKVKHYSTGERWGLYLKWEHDTITVTVKPNPPDFWDKLWKFVKELVMIVVKTVEGMFDVLKGAMCLLAKQKMAAIGQAAAGKTALTPDQKNELLRLGVGKQQLDLITTGGATLTSAMATAIATQISTALCGADAPPPGPKESSFPTALVLAGGLVAALVVFKVVRK